MKLWKWFLKCPMLFLLLAGWIGLTAFTWSEDRMPRKLGWELVETPVFTALLEPEVPDEVLNDPDLDFEEEDSILASAAGPQNAGDQKDDAPDRKGQSDTSGTAAVNQDDKDQQPGQADGGHPPSDTAEGSEDDKDHMNQTVNGEGNGASHAEKGTADKAGQSEIDLDQEIGRQNLWNIKRKRRIPDIIQILARKR